MVAPASQADVPTIRAWLLAWTLMLLAWTAGAGLACEGRTPRPKEGAGPRAAASRPRPLSPRAPTPLAALPCPPASRPRSDAIPRWPEDPGLFRRDPPALPLPPRKAWPALVHLERLLADRGPAAARPKAALLAASIGPEHLAAVIWSCPPCTKDILGKLRRRAEKTGWSWTEARHLLPLGGHPREEVRALTLWTFGAAATRLGPGPLKERLEFHLPVWRGMALDPSPWVRAEALALLGLLGDRRAHALMVGLLDDPFGLVRAAAARAIARAVTLVPGAPSTRAVCARLEDPSPWVRAVVLEVLAEAQGACPLPVVAALLGDRFRVRLRLLTALSGDQGLLGDGGEVRHWALRALPPAFRLSDPDEPWDLRLEKARASLARAGIAPAAPPGPATPLGACAPSPWRPTAPPGRVLAGSRAAARPRTASHRALVALGGAASSSQDLVQALAALEGMPLGGDLGRAVLELLGHSEAQVRWIALVRLDAGGADEDRRALLERALWLLSHDPHPLVRAAALGALVSHHGGSAPWIETGLRDAHAAVRLAAVEALAQARPARARDRLPSLLEDPSPAVRAAAIHRLVRDPLASPPLAAVIRALDDRAPAFVRVSIGGSEERIDPGFGTVRGAALMGLEAARGVLHRGTDEERARRWQDDLRLGWAPRERP